MESVKEARIQNSGTSPDRAVGINIIYYSDPLCCWSWAMEPVWKRIQSEFSEELHVQYKMGGLLPSWKQFNDGSGNISRPSQMGPEWMMAAQVSGVTINSKLWTTDPPESSFPACIAVKCVELQSAAMVETYLDLLRKAVMVENRNIARTGILLELGWVLHDRYPDFNLFTFKSDLLGNTGKAAFSKDLQEAKYLNINRFPTLIIRHPDRQPVILTGYQSYESLKAELTGK